MGEEAERRTAVVEAGATHWAELDLIDLDADGPAIRSVLEQFRLRGPRTCRDRRCGCPPTNRQL
jgi:hypothetical protein